MAFTATDVGFGDLPPGLFAKSFDLHTPLEGSRHRAGYFGAQRHEFAGIGAGDGRDWAGPAQFPGPMRSGRG